MDHNEHLNEVIKHFTHSHPMKLTTYSYYNRCCYCCKSLFSPDYGDTDEIVMYACVECKEKLCVLCARLGESVERHALHPLHPRLKLVDNRENIAQCSACCEIMYGNNFRYHCDDDKCDFEMHVRCAHSPKPTVTLSHGRSHSHLLTLVVSNRASRVLICESCRSAIPRVSSFVRCVPCNLSYHIYCNKSDFIMPVFVFSPECHTEHRLILHRPGSYWSCDVCFERDRPDIFVYTCTECNQFTAHISCVFQSVPCPFSNSVSKFDVDMRIQGGILHEAAQCQRCNKRILNELSVYGCQYCNLYLHGSCTSSWLQQPMVEGNKDGEIRISHPGYNNNPLVLVFAHGMGFTCACCERRCSSGFMFQGQNDERFVLDLECIFLVPSLELIGHDHRVILLLKDFTEKPYLRCCQCRRNFSINEPSCRFPRTISHERHFHPLTLVPRLEDDDIYQCYCDVCEAVRDPDVFIYYCAICKFEACVRCVKSKVVGTSGSELEVEFITLQEIDKNEEAKKIKVRDVLCLEEELQHSYNDVSKEFDDIFRIAKEMTWENSIGENLSNINEFLDKTFYSHEPFKIFIKKLNSNFLLEETHVAMKSLRNEEVVRVEEHLVPLKFEGFVEALFDEYGDFGATCSCSKEAKQYLFVGLCKALQTMCNTKIARVTESLLVEWWRWFAMGKAAGFKIQFVLKSFKRVVLAHFGLEADKYALGRLTDARNEIRELPKKIEELTRELDETRTKLEGAIRTEKEIREEVFIVKKSPLMKECLQEANDLVCYTVGETFLPPSD